MLIPAPAMFPLFAQIGDSFDRPAVNSHAHAQLGIPLEFARDLDRALHRVFRTGAKYQGAAIARRQTH
ncbi:MAG: hypothetical protein DME32_08405 [Verrucomicrobia bacterium]|nr:MAG: hypothetical protein DME32_08405 [Verrucomicrobiota bacterium]